MSLRWTILWWHPPGDRFGFGEWSWLSTKSFATAKEAVAWLSEYERRRRFASGGFVALFTHGRSEKQ